MRVGFKVLVSCVLQSSWVYAQFYPLNNNGDVPSNLVPFSKGQNVPLECISRDIADGRHRLDEKDNIVYSAFPTCQETGQPLSLKFGVNSDINCTITMNDELYHLFQFYIHEDSPFSCRLPMSNENNYLEQGGASIPLAFNFRGEIHDSHLDIDTNVNILTLVPQTFNTFISAVAWSSGTETTRVVIGETVTLQLAIRWFKGYDVAKADSNTPLFIDPESTNIGADKLSEAYARGFYKVKDVSKSYIHIYQVILLVISAVIISVITTLIMDRNRKRATYMPVHDTEQGWDKKD